MVYPSQQGPIATTKWEAFREGIDDYRYVLTLSTLLDEYETSDPTKVARIRATLQEKLEPFEDPANLENLNGDNFDETRRWIQEQIVYVEASL